METAEYPQRVIMRALRSDHDNLATIAGQLRAAGREPTVTTILRHALSVAAGSAGREATLISTEGPEPKSINLAAVGGPIQVFTDGACSGNPGPGGWAAVFVREGAVAAEYSGGDKHTTNNRMELAGVREAILRAPDEASLEIMTDSKVVIGWLSQGWKRNVAEIAMACGEIDRLIHGRAGLVTFTHVRGHAGHTFNERADRLAVAARDRAGQRSALT